MLVSVDDVELFHVHQASVLTIRAGTYPSIVERAKGKNELFFNDNFYGTVFHSSENKPVK